MNHHQGPAVPAGFRLVAFDSVGSTNAEALKLAAAGAASGTVVWAKEQTEGRGRRGRAWESPPGNLYCSLVLRPSRANPAQLSFVAAVALAEAMAEMVPGGLAQLKWPNDVLFRGRKVAGILLEGGGEPLVLGTGVNVAHAPAGATSLHAEGAAVAVDGVLGAYLSRLGEWLARWEQGGFAPVREAWLGRALGLGQAIEVRLPGETLAGSFEGLDGEGVLLLATPNGTRRIAAGDVYLMN